LGDLDDLDPKFASIINAKIESELKNGPSLAHSAPPAPSECEPPSPRNHSQSARVLLSQLGLLSSQSLQVIPQLLYFMWSYIELCYTSLNYWTRNLIGF